MGGWWFVCGWCHVYGFTFLTLFFLIHIICSMIPRLFYVLLLTLVFASFFVQSMPIRLQQQLPGIAHAPASPSAKMYQLALSFITTTDSNSVNHGSASSQMLSTQIFSPVWVMLIIFSMIWMIILDLDRLDCRDSTDSPWVESRWSPHSIQMVCALITLLVETSSYTRSCG